MISVVTLCLLIVGYNAPEMPGKGRFTKLRLRFKEVTIRRGRLDWEQELKVTFNNVDAYTTSASHGPIRGHTFIVWDAALRAWEHRIDAAWANSEPGLNVEWEEKVVSRVPPPLSYSRPQLLRFDLEGGCLRYQEPLELLARATCHTEQVEQHFVWEAASHTLRSAMPIPNIDHGFLTTFQTLLQVRC